MGKDSSPRKKRRKLSSSASASPAKVEVAALYHEDIADEAASSLSAPAQHRPASIAPLKVNRAEKQRRKDRMARFGVAGATSSQAVGAPAAAAAAKKVAPASSTLSVTDSLERALASSRTKNSATGSNHHANDETTTTTKTMNNSVPFVGTSTSLEKPYLRLTTFPKPESVRPEPLLRKALKHIKNRYLQTEDFDWTNEQLKSVRQDLTVQNIRNALTLETYETHARILLEHGDLNEFNQCQCNIQSLLVHDNNNSNNTNDGIQQSEESVGEFRAYAILYALVRNADMDLKLLLRKHRLVAEANTAPSRSPSSAKKKLKKSRKRNRSKSNGNKDDDSSTSGNKTTTATASISAPEDHAWQVVRAVQDNAYRTFFRLYHTAPHLSAYLMDFLVQRVRTAAWKSIVAAYRPHVSCEHVRDCLRLDDLEETRRFLRQQDAVYLQENSCSSGSGSCSGSGGGGGSHEPPFWIDCKLSCVRQQQKHKQQQQSPAASSSS